MASKQLLRRIPLLAREGWSQIGLAPGAAGDISSLAAATSAAQDATRPAPGARPPVGANVGKFGNNADAPAPQTLGQWTQRLSHLQSLQKPLGTLAISGATDVTRPPPWPLLAQSLVVPSSTSIAAATMPPVVQLLKQEAISPISTAPTSSSQQLPTAASTPLLEASTSATTATDASPATATASSLPPALPPAPYPAPPLPTQHQHQHQLLPPPPPPPQRRSSSGRNSSAINSSIQLNKHITACRSTEELLALVQARGSQFDYFNISTALARVPKLAGGLPLPHHHHAGSGAGLPPLPPGSAMAAAQGSPAAAGDLHTDAAGRSLMDLLAQLMVAHIDNFDARGLANSAWAFGKLKYVPSGGLPAVIAAAARRRMSEFSPQNLSNLVWSFVYMHHADEALLAAAARMVAGRVAEFKPQELANIVWAFASLGYRDEQMLQVVAAQAQRIAPLFKEQELSNVLWALGKMGVRRPDVLESLMAETRAKLPAFLPQGISNVAWALAAVGHADTRFLDQVVRQCGPQLGAFDVQALANLVWAMASLGYYQPHFVAAVVGECLGRGLDRLSPQNLSNILWGCATLGHKDPRMLSAWAAQTLEKLSSFEPQGLSNTAWAFARLGYHSPPLFAALAAAAMHRLDGFNAQGLSNIAWAMATANSPQPRLFEALSRTATALAPTFNAQNCSVTLWSCAALRHYDAQLFDALLARLVDCGNGVQAAPSPPAAPCGHSTSSRRPSVAGGRISSGSGNGGGMPGVGPAERDACEPQNVANALWAVARMGHPLRPELAGALVEQSVRLLPRMSQQEVCNTMWALAVMDLLDERLFATFCDTLTGHLGDISPEGIHQAYHAQLMLHSKLLRQGADPASPGPASPFLQSTSSPSGTTSAVASSPTSSTTTTAASPSTSTSSSGMAPRQLPTLPEPLHTVAASMWAASARDVHVSRFQQEVSGALSVAGVPHALEWMTNDEHFSVDIGLQVNQQPTAVEVNGAHHYTSNPPHRPLGDMAVRRRLLEDRGWAVVDVGFADWEAMGRNLVERGSSLVGHIATSLGDWDWQSVGLPNTGSGAIATVADPAAAAAAAAAAQQQQQQAEALAAAMGLGPLFTSDQQQQQRVAATAASVLAAAASAWPTAAATAASTLGLGSGLLGELGRTAGGPVPMDAEPMERSGSSASGMDEGAVSAALAAAEALAAVPGGNLLLAQQMYDVLGVQLPQQQQQGGEGGSSALAMAAAVEQLAGMQRRQETLAGLGMGMGTVPAAGAGAGANSLSSDWMLMAMLGQQLGQQQQQLQLLQQARVLAGQGQGQGQLLQGLGSEVLLGHSGMGDHAQHAVCSEEHEDVSDDDLERMVQYAIA